MPPSATTPKKSFDGKLALQRPVNGATDPADIQVDFAVIRRALPQRIEGVEHQAGHDEVGEQKLGGPRP